MQEDDEYEGMLDMYVSDDEEEVQRPERCMPSYADMAKDNNEQMKLVDVQTGKLAKRVVPGRKYQFQKQAVKPKVELNLFTHVVGDELNVLPNAQEPEFVEVEMTADTGATVHALDKSDLPFHTMRPSAGSKVQQHFQAAGGKLIPNEGEIDVVMVPPDVDSGIELSACFQCAKVTRPLLSITKITESGKLKFVCEKDDAKIVDLNGKVLAVFKRKGGLYTTVMNIRNPRFQPFQRQDP